MTIALAHATEIGQFIANMVPYKIMIDGVEEQFEKPVVNINGSTYIAVRELCEKLGVYIEWKEKEKEVVINTDEEMNPDSWTIYDENGIYNTDDSKYGYMDKTGKIKIPAQYDDAYEFSEGLAVVAERYDYEELPDADTDAFYGTYWYINSKGERVYTKEKVWLSTFKNGLAMAKVGAFGYLYYINKEFEKAFDGAFANAKPFSEGYAAVKIEGSTYPHPILPDKWSYIDMTGKRATEMEFEAAIDFGGGRAVVKNNGKWGVIDNEFNLVVDYQYDNVQIYTDSFTYGLLAVEKDGKWGYIDKDGKVIIDFKYDEAYEFQNGLASVCVDNKYGFINTKGEVVIPFRFQYAQTFFEGLAVARDNIDGHSGFGYINTKGEYVIEPNYIEAQPFKNGLARVRSERKEIRYHYINKKGERVDPHD